MLDATEAAHEATLAYVRAPVGEIDSPLNTYFALVADDPSVQIVNAAQRWYARASSAARAGLAGPADSLGLGAVQMRRARRAGLLYRRPRRADRDQERRRYLSSIPTACGW